MKNKGGNGFGEDSSEESFWFRHNLLCFDFDIEDNTYSQITIIFKQLKLTLGFWGFGVVEFSSGGYKIKKIFE